MNLFWENKVVVITGSTMGIGKMLALEIGKKRAKVVINGRNKKRLLDTKNELEKHNIKVLALAGDISIFEDCENIGNAVNQEFGTIDVLINNAGIASFGSFADTNISVFKKVIDINFIGSANMTKATIPFINKNASILFIGSVAGMHGIGNSSAYCCSKMALTALAESLQIELTGISVGIAYVGFTTNDDEKLFLDSRGNFIKVPSRENVKQMPQEKVARKIMWMIEKRKFKTTFSTLGKLTNILSRFLPFLLQSALKKVHQKQLQNVRKKAT